MAKYTLLDDEPVKVEKPSAKYVLLEDENPSTAQNIKQGAGNLLAGAVRGAGSIGATIAAPYDIAKDALAGRGLSLQSNRERRQAMDDALQTMGAETDSWMYKGGKLAGEIAGTAGTGGVLAKGAQAVGAAPSVVMALRTAGMTTGNIPTTLGAKAADLAIRTGAGAAVGGAAAGLTNPEDAKAGALIGGALPGATKAAGYVGEKIGQGARKVLGKTVAPEVADLAKRAQQLGIDIPVDRLVDSKPMNAIASGLNYVPFSGRAGTEAKLNSQLNQALSRTFGQDSSNVTMALRKANDSLGMKFENVLSKNGVNVDKQFLDDVAGVFNKAERELGSDALKPIASKIDDLMTKASSGVIDGQAAYNIKRDLDRLGRGSTPTAFHALELKGKLMDALDRSLGPAQAKAFAETRKQYGNMLALEKLAKNGVEGEISAARLGNMKNINNKDLQELADIAAQFVKSREGQHGAMQRALVGLGVAGTAGPAGLVGGATAGRVANATLNSDALRSLMLGQPVNSKLGNLLANEQAQQLMYRAAPIAASR